VIRLVVVGEPAVEGDHAEHADPDAGATGRHVAAPPRPRPLRTGTPTDLVADGFARQARGVRVPVGPVVTATDVAAVRAALTAAASAGDAVGLVPADLVTHSSLLGDVLDDPRRPVAALVLDDDRLGALRLDAAAARKASARLAAVPVRADLLDTVLDAVATGGVPVARVTPGRLVVRRPGDAADARSAAYDALTATSEHTDRLAGVARPADGLYSTFVVRRLSRPLTGVAVRLGASPNTVTLVSLVLGLAAAGLLTSPGVVPRVLGALLLQVSLVVDCVDGELARYTRRFTPLGAWLDGVGDRVKEYAVLAALAVAAGRAAADAPSGGTTASGGWLLAVAAMVVMTYRHVADHGFTERDRAGRPAPAAGLAPAGDAQRETVVVWLRRVLQFPVGERWLVLSVVAAVAGPRTALVTFCWLGLASAVWTTTGRMLRALRWGGGTDRFGWLVPALVWVGEGAVVAAAFWLQSPGEVWAGYVLLAVVAYHLYDTVYRAKYRVPGPPHATVRAGLGHLKRALLVVALAVTAVPLPDGVLRVGTLVLTAWLVLVFGGESARAWRRWLRSRPRMEEDG